MARPRNFDEEEALSEVMLTFWRHGYEATTYRMLEKATGVKGRSLINVFGDKDALFVKVLQRYHSMAANAISKVFDPPNIGSIRSMFSVLTTPPENADDIRNAGCLMVNTVFELGKTRPKVRAEVDAYRELWRSTFETALQNSDITDSTARAEFLVGLLWGALSQIRLTGSVESVASMASVVHQTLDGWEVN